MKKALAAWGESSSESGDSDCPEDASMLVIQYKVNVFDEMLSLMAKSDDKDKVTLLDFKQNLNTYSIKRM